MAPISSLGPCTMSSVIPAIAKHVNVNRDTVPVFPMVGSMHDMSRLVRFE